MNQKDSKTQSDFLSLIRSALSLSFAGLVALLSSIEQINPGFRFKVDFKVIIFSILGGLLTWNCMSRWMNGVIRREKGLKPGFKTFMSPLLAVCAASILTFGYFLKELPPSTLKDMTVGSLMAILVLSLVAVLMWRVTCFLRDQESTTDDDAR